MNASGLVQFTLYAMVGALGTALHYAVLLAGVSLLDASAVSASTAGAVLGAVTNYALNYRFTFRSRNRHVPTLMRFATVAASGVAVNGGAMAVATHVLGIHYFIAQLVATATVLACGFAANRAWTFRDGRHGKQPA